MELKTVSFPNAGFEGSGVGCLKYANVVSRAVSLQAWTGG